MESKIREAVDKKISGKYNCAQAVACSYADVVQSDEDALYNAAAAFGAGMGCMEGTCGAIVGAGIVLGLKYKDKARAMKALKQVLLAFKQRNGCTICKQLKGLETKKVVRECNDCVADAAEFLENVLTAE
ncbi:MAG TPA: hypothetical protein DDZ04_09710 [Parabacteroides sp.]|nr:hypothetical protein [Parabacteroides sp.]